jgi:predicted enzyme related to lactoylglutathione lyase
LHRDPYLRLVLAEFVDVGISEHTAKVCDASRTASVSSADLEKKARRSSVCERRSLLQDAASLFEQRSIGQGDLHAAHWRFDMVKGLGTVIYPVTDLNGAKTWYATAFQQKPYFDEPFYVGFNIAGYELGLDPNPNQTMSRPGPGGGVAYWRVADVDAAVEHFVTAGTTVAAPVLDVGGNIKVATVTDPFGNMIGLIENPHFELPKP